MECIKCGHVVIRVTGLPRLCDYCVESHTLRMERMNHEALVPSDLLPTEVPRQPNRLRFIGGASGQTGRPNPIPVTLFEDGNAGKRKASRVPISVMCCYADDGCEWSGALSELSSHTKYECLFNYVPCPLRCHVVVLRGNLDDHISATCENRAVVCRSCGALLPLQDLDRHVADGECPKYRVGARTASGGNTVLNTASCLQLQESLERLEKNMAEECL